MKSRNTFLTLLTLNVALIVGSNCNFATASCDTKLGPTDKRSTLIEQLDEAYVFVVRGNKTTLDRARTLHVMSESNPQPMPLDVVGGIATSLKVRDAINLCSDTGLIQLWYVHPGLVDAYVKTMSGIGYAIRTQPPPGVINLSLGPPVDVLPMRGDDADPMHIATRLAADKGLLPIIAIGNKPTDGVSPGTNPWCLPAWVVCVGAASRDGKTLWPGSVEGSASEKQTWPDVVAAGVDIISTWPSNMVKSDARRQRDESDKLFRDTIPREKWNSYTLETGTSQATAHVSRAAAQIIHFVKSLATDTNPNPGEKLFTLELPNSQVGEENRRAARFTGTVVRRSGNIAEIEYKLVEPWKLVKQLLLDTAVPMPRYKPNEVGAGLVDPDYIDLQFSKYGKGKPKILPIKVR